MTAALPVRSVDDLRGRRTVVLGLARSGVAASRFLADAGAVVAAYDRRPASDLAEAIVDVNRYSRHVKIELAEPKLGELRVSGSYMAGDPELVVAAWEATMPVRAKHVGNRIQLMHK